MVIVGNAIQEGVYPFYKGATAPDQGVGLLRWSMTPSISSLYLPHICASYSVRAGIMDIHMDTP